jgi:hypothetical protein
MNVWKKIDDYLMQAPALSTQRLPTFYPSAASCIPDNNEGTTVGACLRANYYRCAGYSKSDADSLWSQYVFAGGNIWEDWITEQCKKAGIWRGNSLKFQDLKRYISGEVDILVEDDKTGEIIIVEVKTFFGYEGKKKICGNTTVKPSPKDPHILQAFLYLGQFADQGIEKVALLYFARDDHSRQQFTITKHVENGKTYPRIVTDYRGAQHDYVDYRITLEGIYGRYDELMEVLKKGELPDPDFEHEYSAETIEVMWEEKKIGKTAYEKWKRKSETNPIGYFMCRSYCSYRTMCAEQKKTDGHR